MSAAIMNYGMFSVENKMSLRLFPFFRTKERNLFLFESILFFDSFPDSEKEIAKRILFEYQPYTGNCGESNVIAPLHLGNRV